MSGKAGKEGIAIVEFCSSLSLTQAEFAREVGASRANISTWKKCDKLPDGALRQIFYRYRNEFPFKKHNISLSEVIPFYKEEEPFYCLLKSTEAEDYSESVEYYFYSLVKAIRSTKADLSVYNYLARSKNDRFIANSNSPTPLSSEQKKYFNVISEVFCNKEITYSRMLVLPLRRYDNINIPVEQHLIKVIALMIQLEFEHICRCFAIDKLAKKNKFKLYICSAPNTLDSFMCVDNRKLILECDVYNDGGQSRPSDLFIYTDNVNTDDTKTYTQQIIKTYNKKFSRLVRNGLDKHPPVWQITERQFVSGIKQAIKRAEEDLNKMNEVVKDGSRSDLPIALSGDIDDLEGRIEALKKKEKSMKAILIS